MNIIDSVIVSNIEQNISAQEALNEFLDFSEHHSLIHFGNSNIPDIVTFQKETADIYGFSDEIPAGALVLQKNLLIATAMAGRTGISLFFAEKNKQLTLSRSGRTYCHPLNMLATIGHMARMVDASDPNHNFARKASALAPLDMKSQGNLLFASIHSKSAPTQELIKLDINWYLDSKYFEQLNDYYKEVFKLDLLNLIEMAIKATPSSL